MKNKYNIEIENTAFISEEQISKYDESTRNRLQKIQKEIERKIKYDSKPLHFHFFLTMFFLFLGLFATILFAFSLYSLKTEYIGDLLLSSKGILILNVIIISSFVLLVWMLHLILCRVFFIGRHQRILKANIKHQEHAFAYLEKMRKVEDDIISHAKPAEDKEE